MRAERDRDRRRTLGRVLLTAVALASLLGAVTCSSTGSSSGSATSAPGYKITVAGDSISIGLGASLRKVVAADTVVKVIGVEGSGLAHPDNFDWPARLAELARDLPPQVLVLSLSSNDAQDLTDTTGKVVVPFSDTKAWDSEYSKRLAASIDPFATTGTTVVWVGHVRTTEDKVGGTNRHVQQLAAAMAAGRSYVIVSDLAELLDTGEARADRCLMPDGLHLTVACLDEAAGRLKDTFPRR